MPRDQGILLEAGIAVIRGQAVIQNALDLQQYCIENLTHPREGSKVYHRYFHVTAMTADDIPPKGMQNLLVPPKASGPSIRSVALVSQVP